MPEGKAKQSVAREVKVEAGGKAVLANRIEHLHLSSESATATPFGPFDSVPPLPPNFIPRPEVTEPIIQSLFNSPTVSLTAIEGMGGVGKTIAANEVCHDERIRKASPKVSSGSPLASNSA